MNVPKSTVQIYRDCMRLVNHIAGNVRVLIVDSLVSFLNIYIYGFNLLLVTYFSFIESKIKNYKEINI